MKAIRMASTGGPDMLEFVDVVVAAPGPGEVLLRQTAVGLNFIDTYHRSGLYPLPMPSGLGLEACVRRGACVRRVPDPADQEALRGSLGVARSAATAGCMSLPSTRVANT